MANSFMSVHSLSLSSSIAFLILIAIVFNYWSVCKVATNVERVVVGAGFRANRFTLVPR
jgi:hypothetical protein